MGGSGDYSKHEYVNLYLVRASLKGRKFYKIGLTLYDDPIRRDPKVYKEVVRCKKIPGQGDEIPYIYEKLKLFCL